MNRRRFTLAGLAGLLGIKALAAQEPNVTHSGTVARGWETISPCHQNETIILGSGYVECVKNPKEGEELCPLGHSQKPRPIYVEGVPSDLTLMEITKLMNGQFVSVLKTCSICGIVYVPVEPKP